MLVALQLVIVAAVPLNLTVLLPWVEPKFVPVIVTAAPTAPDVGERLVMLGEPNGTAESEKARTARWESFVWKAAKRMSHLRA